MFLKYGFPFYFSSAFRWVLFIAVKKNGPLLTRYMYIDEGSNYCLFYNVWTYLEINKYYLRINKNIPNRYLGIFNAYED